MMLSGASVSNGLRDSWYVVADSSDVEDAPLAVGVLGEHYVLWRTSDGNVHATVDRCPHREAPLSAGHVADDCLVCPYHGWTFDSLGVCVRVPSAAPATPIPPAARLGMLPVRERYGVIWFSPGSPGREPPNIPQDDDTTYRRSTAGIESWRTSATRMTDNFCDVAHFPFVHAGTIGDVNPVVEGIEIEQLDADFTGYRYTVDVLDEGGNTVRQQMSTGFHLPFVVRSNTTYESGPRRGQDRVLLLCTTPVDDATSLFTFIVWRNHDHDLSSEEFLAFDRAIGAEDKAMLEQIGGALPLENTASVSVKSDRLSVRWRQMFSQLAQP